jgi:hypothetical protein
MLPAKVHVLATGSKSSALVSEKEASLPPATSTLPFAGSAGLDGARHRRARGKGLEVLRCLRMQVKLLTVQDGPVMNSQSYRDK